MAKENGWPGEFRLVPPKRLKVDSKYQRGEHYRRAQQIAEDFDWKDFSALVVSGRRGGYFVVDGQHRAVGAGLAGKSEVPCLVFKGLQVRDEAAAFVDINTKRKPVDPVDVWKARLRAEDPDTEEAQKVLARYGYRVSRLRSTSHITIRCAQLVRRLYSAEQLADTLHFLTGCWPKHPLIGKAFVMASVAKFLVLWGSTKPAPIGDVMETLKRHDLDTISARARGLLQYGSGDSMVACHVAVMREIYNKGKRGKARLTE